MTLALAGSCSPGRGRGAHRALAAAPRRPPGADLPPALAGTAQRHRSARVGLRWAPPAGADRVKVTLADHAGVDGALRRTLKSVRGDLLVVFWGGHGAVDQERQQRLFLADATIDDRKNVSLERLLLFLRSSYFEDLPEQLVCVDACASRFDDRSSEMRLPTEEYPDGKDVPGRKQVLLRAATRGQVALESKRQKKGLFSRELLAALDADPASAWPPDLRAVAVSLKSRFAELAAELPSEQLPSLWTYDDDDGTIPWRAPSATRVARPGRDAARLRRSCRPDARLPKVLRERDPRSGASPTRDHRLRRPRRGASFARRARRHRVRSEARRADTRRRSAASTAAAPMAFRRHRSRGPQGPAHRRVDAVRNTAAETTAPTPAMLLRDPALQGHRLVVYHHVWTVDGWTDDDERLLQWYLDDYWTGIPADDATPRPLIFMKMICADELSRVGFGSLLRGSLTPKHRLRASLEPLRRRRVPAVAASCSTSWNQCHSRRWSPGPTRSPWRSWLSEAEANTAAESIFAGPGGLTPRLSSHVKD